MKKKRVNNKDLSINMYYYYLNVHLELLFKAINENNKEDIELQTSQIKNARDKLLKLGYFGVIV